MNESEQKKLLKQHYRNFSEISIEIIKSISMQPSELLKHVSFENSELLEQALQQKQTIVLALAHHCNQEWAMLPLPSISSHGFLNLQG